MFRDTGTSPGSLLVCRLSVGQCESSLSSGLISPLCRVSRLVKINGPREREESSKWRPLACEGQPPPSRILDKAVFGRAGHGFVYKFKSNSSKSGSQLC